MAKAGMSGSGALVLLFLAKREDGSYAFLLVASWSHSSPIGKTHTIGWLDLACAVPEHADLDELGRVLRRLRPCGR